ncbi:hypothetical protein Dimus_038629 [Dionaea muscipula]
MAVPGRLNGLMEDEDEDGGVEDGILMEEGEYLLADENSDTPPHLRVLAAAATYGDLHSLRLALDSMNDSIDEPLEDGDTALHLTCLYGHLPCVQLLLERSANLEIKDEDGAIPLHDACAGGFTDIVQLLISSASGPDQVKRMLDTADFEGDTPLHHAARGQHANVIRILLQNGASATKKNACDKMPGELAEPQTEASTILAAASGAVEAS